MNKQRRARIAALVANLTEVNIELDLLLEEEQESYDNMPESFQDGERGELAQSAIDCFYEIIDNINSTIEDLNIVIEQ